jgi:hypothetical protein
VNLAVVHVAAVSRIQIHQFESTVAAHQARVLARHAGVRFAI